MMKINRQENETAHFLAMKAKIVSNHSLPSFSYCSLNHQLACAVSTSRCNMGPVDLIDVICF